MTRRSLSAQDYFCLSYFWLLNMPVDLKTQGWQVSEKYHLSCSKISAYAKWSKSASSQSWTVNLCHEFWNAGGWNLRSMYVVAPSSRPIGDCVTLEERWSLAKWFRSREIWLKVCQSFWALISYTGLKWLPCPSQSVVCALQHCWIWLLWVQGLWQGWQVSQPSHTASSTTRAEVLTCRAVGSTREIHLISCCSFVSEAWGTSFPIPIFTVFPNIWIEGKGGNAISPWVTHPNRVCLVHPSAQELGLWYLSLHDNQEGLEPSAGSPYLASQGTGSWEGSMRVQTFWLSLEQGWQSVAWDCHAD